MLQVNRTQIHYEDKGTGPVLVLLHGVWMSSRFFSVQIDALSKTHRVIALDFRGHGQSAFVAHGHTVPQYARDLHAMIDALGLSRVALLGWSMGAFVIWDYIKQFGTQRLEAVVVVDESASDFKWPDWSLGFVDLPTLVHFMESVQMDQTTVVDHFIPAHVQGTAVGAGRAMDEARDHALAPGGCEQHPVRPNDPRLPRHAESHRRADPAVLRCRLETRAGGGGRALAQCHSEVRTCRVRAKQPLSIHRGSLQLQ
jgi:pimeloyl-ACP methyl ester carboxylesterase